MPALERVGMSIQTLMIGRYAGSGEDEDLDKYETAYRLSVNKLEMKRKAKEKKLRKWSPTGKPVVPNRRPCGATSRPHDGAFIHGQGRGLPLVGIRNPTSNGPVLN